MKIKLELLCAAVFLLTLPACKKNSNVSSPQTAGSPSKTLSSATRLAPQDLVAAVNVSPYGFLVLDSPALSMYADFLYNNNSNDILSFLSSKGVVSQVVTNGQADNAIPPAPENGGYMFNHDGIVQIGGLVIRGVNNGGYLLAMPADHMSGQNYQNLASEIFDPTVMCKLSLNKDYAPDDLETFVRANIGFNDVNGSNPPPPPDPQAIFWGWGDWHRTGGVACHRHYYILWIKVDTQYGYCP